MSSSPTSQRSRTETTPTPGTSPARSPVTHCDSLWRCRTGEYRNVPRPDHSEAKQQVPRSLGIKRDDDDYFNPAQWVPGSSPRSMNRSAVHEARDPRVDLDVVNREQRAVASSCSPAMRQQPLRKYWCPSLVRDSCLPATGALSSYGTSQRPRAARTSETRSLSCRRCAPHNGKAASATPHRGRFS